MYHNADFMSNQELKRLDLASLKNILISKNTTIVGAKIFLGDNVRIDPFTFLLCPKGYIKIEKFTHVASHVFIAGHNGFKLGKFLDLELAQKFIQVQKTIRVKEYVI